MGWAWWWSSSGELLFVIKKKTADKNADEDVEGQDLSFTVSLLAYFYSQYGNQHWEVSKRFITPDTCPKDFISYFGDTCSDIFIITLLTKLENVKSLDVLILINGQWNCVTYTQWDSSVKKNEVGQNIANLTQLRFRIPNVKHSFSFVDHSFKSLDESMQPTTTSETSKVKRDTGCEEVAVENGMLGQRRCK